MPNSEVVISVRDGVFEIFASDEDVDILLVDWDVPREASEADGVVLTTQNHRLLQAFVSHPNPRPLYVLAGGEIEAVIEAAERRELCSEATS